ncbi:MAG: hypothetical protein AUG49_11690 [Catenulispora sp. 13_1_20CM_3_70_7]|nr:MAG: hypothetical protein AUG49_11690 [Catenulispora sp. 13_1_20CM_3_70_7]
MIDNALLRYADEVRGALTALGADRPPDAGFTPGFALPAVDDRVRRYFSACQLAVADLGDYRGRRLRMLDLMRNPRTKTTKTGPSLVIVARAVEFIQRTGEPVLLVSPSSGNKVTALRDAVLRAYETGLATPEQLGIVVVVPGSSVHKLWDSPLSADPALRARNPVVTYDGRDRADVKALAQSLVDGHGAAIRDEFGVHLWYTLEIGNYLVADVIRAAAEEEFLPRAEGRLHVHAVSSAYGLLGHDLGARRLAAARGGKPTAHYFLVQHLDTADMVLSLYHGSVSREHRPAYRLDEATMLYRQDDNPRFPAVTYDPGEILVSLYEVLQRYPLLRAMLGRAGTPLPADPRDLREWSLVMALTGILNAIDRDLVDETDILVHGSGTYSVDDFSPIPPDRRTAVTDVGALYQITRRAAGAGAVPATSAPGTS